MNRTDGTLHQEIQGLNNYEDLNQDSNLKISPTMSGCEVMKTNLVLVDNAESSNALEFARDSLSQFMKKLGLSTIKPIHSKTFINPSFSSKRHFSTFTIRTKPTIWNLPFKGARSFSTISNLALLAGLGVSATVLTLPFQTVHRERHSTSFPKSISHSS